MRKVAGGDDSIQLDGRNTADVLHSKGAAPADPADFVQWAYWRIVGHACPTADCEFIAGQLASGSIDRYKVLEDLVTSSEFRDRYRLVKKIAFPDGHFYSPVPSVDDIAKYPHDAHNDGVLPGIDLQEEKQLALLAKIGGLYPSIPFSNQPKAGFRYYYDNPAYAFGDGIFLHSMIRYFSPRRIIEVGSGFSSCVTLDTNEHFFDGRIECTFIDPHPALLRSLIRPDDKMELISQSLQDIDLAVFKTLERNDILFVDSTHVSKLNSDVNRLFFDILPSLKAGVLIHIHDVWYPLEYPLEYFEDGRAWTEQYLLRAFLQYNTHFRIRLFPSYVVKFHRSWFASNAPLVLHNPGGSIWLEKYR